MNNSGNWSIHLQSALEKIQEHDLSAALEIILEIVDCTSRNTRLINLLADCYYYLGEFDRAEACWIEVLKINPNDKEAKGRIGRFNTPSFQSWVKRYKHALYNIEQKNYESALKSLRELMEENDGFVSVYQFLGLCYMACGELDQAGVVWEKGLEKDISNEAIKAYLSILPGTDSKTQEEPYCEESGETTLKKAPIHLPSRKTIVTAGAVMSLFLIAAVGINFNQADNREVPKTAEIQTVPQGVEAEPLQEDTPVFSDDLVNVEENSSGGSDYDVERETYYYNQGYQAYLDGDFKQASSNLGVVVSMKAGDYLNREALYYLARTYYLQGNYNEAEKYYLQYLEEFPETNYVDDSLFYLGAVYHATGEDQKAVQVFEEMQRLSPNCGYESSSLFKTVMSEK